MTLDVVYQPLREQIRDVLRRRIITGELKPGDRILETELATELGVSRLPVREAIRMLEIEGFVAVLPRRGVTVRDLSRQEVDDLFDVRAALEPLACRRAAEKAGDEGRRRLRASLTAARRAIDAGDIHAEGTTNEGFHDLIVVLSGNSILKGILDPLQGRLAWSLQQYNDPVTMWKEHDRMCRAIERQDVDAAAATALAHVERNRLRAVRVLFGKG